MSSVHSWLSRLSWLGRSSTMRLSMVLSAIFALGFVVTILVALDLGERANERRLDALLEALALGGEIEDGPRFVLRPLDEIEDLPQPLQRAAARGGGTVDLRGDFMGADAWRVLVAPDDEGEVMLVAVPIEDSEDAIELLSAILWTTAAIVIVVTLAIGVWAGFLAQRRFARINRTLGDLAAGDLTARTGVLRSRDDLDDMASNLDQTAGELERLVTQTRALSASIAHDLRTPLARLRAQLEMLPDGEGRSSALEEASRLSGIFDTIMRVARIEAGQGRDGFVPVSLAELSDDIAETFGPVIEDEGKTLVLNLLQPATVQADRAMLVQAMANLIQNALVHGGNRITLFVDGRAVGVADDGNGVDPEHFTEIIKPMVRLDAARRTPGTGLGLALVKAVADRHKARLSFDEEAPSGLRVTIEFTKV